MAPKIHNLLISLDILANPGRMRRDPEEHVLLRGLTHLRRLTHREIARRVGVSATLVSLWVRGKRRVTEEREYDQRIKATANLWRMIHARGS